MSETRQEEGQAGAPLCAHCKSWPFPKRAGECCWIAALASERQRAERMRKALEEIARGHEHAHDIHGSECWICVAARRALGEHPHAEKDGGE